MGTFSADAATFSTGCACLTQNTECDQQCACHATGQCKNCAVSERRVLLLGTDVQEVGAACPRPCSHAHAAAARLCGCCLVMTACGNFLQPTQTCLA